MTFFPPQNRGKRSKKFRFFQLFKNLQVNCCLLLHKLEKLISIAISFRFFSFFVLFPQMFFIKEKFFNRFFAKFYSYHHVKIITIIIFRMHLSAFLYIIIFFFNKLSGLAIFIAYTQIGNQKILLEMFGQRNVPPMIYEKFALNFSNCR